MKEQKSATEDIVPKGVSSYYPTPRNSLFGKYPLGEDLHLILLLLHHNTYSLNLQFKGIFRTRNNLHFEHYLPVFWGLYRCTGNIYLLRKERVFIISKSKNKQFLRKSELSFKCYVNLVFIIEKLLYALYTENRNYCTH